jgi:hypothetical protein
MVDHHDYNNVQVYAGAPAMDDSDRDRSFRDGQQPGRRARPRIRMKVPVELFAPGSNVPERGATSDLSEAGCYIETMFPFPIGTILEMSLQLEGTLLAVGTVVTCDPQVGNGIEFSKMLPRTKRSCEPT